MTVLKAHLRIKLDTLHRTGTLQREIERRTGVDRRALRRYVQLAAQATTVAAANSPGIANGSGVDDPQTAPPRPLASAGSHSDCETHRVWIESLVSAPV